MRTFLESDAEESDEDIDVGDEKTPFRQPPPRPPGMSIKREAFFFYREFNAHWRLIDQLMISIRR